MGTFRLSADATYNMPAHFGEAQLGSYTYADVTTVAVSYQTDRGALAQYIPECFEITRPVVEIGYAMNRGVEWMAGGGYNLVAVNAPVVYRHAPESIEGAYALVVWESKATPILGGREQTGIPKIFADVADLHQLDDRLFGNVSYEGSTFLRIDVRKSSALTADELTAVNQQQGKLNWFGWRYIPNTGRLGAALSHPTLYPIEHAFTAGWHAEGTVDWQVLTREQNPTQAHIISALATLPVLSYEGGIVTRGSDQIRVDAAKELAS